MVTEQAKQIKQDIENFAEKNGLCVKLPQVTGGSFMRRWRLEWGLTRRAVTTVYKVSWRDVVTRVGIGLRNNIRVRVLWERMFPGIPWRVITFDQKPMWFNSNGCSDIHCRTKGLGSGIYGVREAWFFCTPERGLRTYVRT